MALPLRGKIAAVVSDYAVVINLGGDQGVKPGTRFQAIYESPPIPDPDNPETTLGELILQIGTITVQSVMPRMSFCQIDVIPTAFGFETFTSSLGTTKFVRPEVDPGGEPLVTSIDLKLRVGTSVVEMPTEQKKTGQASPAAGGSSR